MANRYIELIYHHQKNIDRLINKIASYQGTYKTDKAIMIALHYAIENIDNNCSDNND
jgi:hypothetical protein